MMKVMDILNKKDSQVWTITPDSTIHDALGILVKEQIGALIVVEKEDICGIISERDIIRECFKNPKKVEKTAIKQIMTKELIVGTPSDEADYIMGIMTNNRIRHIPIIDDSKLIGMISIGDLVKAQLHDTQYENHYLKDYFFGTQ